MRRSDAPALLAVGIARSFGAARVLRGLDLTLDPGDAVAVAGPNGAGKTTLLRILAGLMRPTAGTVHVLGRALVPGASDVRRAIGLLSHQSLLYDDLTLAENLTFAARLYGLPDAPGAARRALAAVGLESRRDDTPRRLSRGTVQRAAVARALIHQPSVLLLDEPFTALDASGVARLRELITGQRAEGRAVVVVTHQLGEAWELVDRVLVIAGGRWALEEPRAGELAPFLSRYHEAIGG